MIEWMAVKKHGISGAPRPGNPVDGPPFKAIGAFFCVFLRHILAVTLVLRQAYYNRPEKCFLFRRYSHVCTAVLSLWFLYPDWFLSISPNKERQIVGLTYFSKILHTSHKHNVSHYFVIAVICFA